MIFSIILIPFCIQISKYYKKSGNSSKKTLPSLQWDESELRFVVPPMFGADAPFFLPHGGGACRAFGKAALCARSGAVFPKARLPDASSLRHPSLLARPLRTPAPSSRNTVHYGMEPLKSQGPSGGQKVALGLISRQARSPLASPWISTSAVATLVATGMQFWSQERSRSLICASF